MGCGEDFFFFLPFFFLFSDLFVDNTPGLLLHCGEDVWVVLATWPTGNVVAAAATTVVAPRFHRVECSHHGDDEDDEGSA